jgi:hypothetical protein
MEFRNFAECVIFVCRADIALIGLAVMGQNLILNMNDHGFVVCAYNRTTEKVDQFLANEAKGTKVVGAKSLQEMVSKLKSPRRVMMLVKGEHQFSTLNTLMQQSWLFLFLILIVVKKIFVIWSFINYKHTNQTSDSSRGSRCAR